MQYHPGQVLTFANGFVGCVTNEYRIALVSPQGWTAKPKRNECGQLTIVHPRLIDYLACTSVIKTEWLPSES